MTKTTNNSSTTNNLLTTPAYTPPDTGAGQGYGGHGDWREWLAYTEQLVGSGMVRADRATAQRVVDAADKLMSLLTRVSTIARQQARWHETDSTKRLVKAGDMAERHLGITQRNLMYDMWDEREDYMGQVVTALTLARDAAALCEYWEEEVLGPIEALSDEERDRRSAEALARQEPRYPTQLANLRFQAR